MSCLSLKPPTARKVWKNLTTKLRSKLHTLQRSKTMKKPPNRLKKATGGVVSRSLFTKQRNKRLAHSHRLRRDFFELKNAPVFVDELFKEPVLVEQCSQPVMDSPPLAKSTKHLDRQAAVPEEGEKNLSGDDMWESLVLASPQLREVNERAEEFIARFRAQMVEEMLAGNCHEVENTGQGKEETREKGFLVVLSHRTRM